MTDTPDPPPTDPGVLAMPDNIRVLQALRRYTDEQMADAIGVSSSTWERRKTRPEQWTLQQARRIALVFGVPLSRLTEPPEES